MTRPTKPIASEPIEREPIEREPIDRRIAVAPMMDWTDRHCRTLMRLIAPSILLYTEMVTTGAILRGARDRFLAFDPCEHKLALQLGGSDPDQLARSAAIGTAYGYDEINLNLGCPSDRVTSGRFGACLMAEPALVAECVAAMISATERPITVKTRIGIDDNDSFAALVDFVGAIAAAGCTTFVIHARKAILSGLSPKENREIPPLRYDVVARLKDQFPGLVFVLNGGITSEAAAREALARFDGVMIGRAAYQNPWLLARLERAVLAGRPAADPASAVLAYLDHVEAMRADGVPLSRLVKPLLGLFQGRPGARRWRRHLSEAGHGPGAGPEVIRAALALVAAAPAAA
ncbi:MAG: tRNA dihydrouridine(20/20a) synthase DusA [Alphaproteobacteria bacterium]|nr:tRNA dihydrouridine(20/20a) synthase DusA [Alphaproteobacteria bacterium]